jgi:glucose-6-phosphate isomerase
MAEEKFYPGFDIKIIENPMGFEYGPGVFGPQPELRSLDAIRKSLLDPGCLGPDPVYAIAMDVGKEKHRTALRQRMLLFGVVTYAKGTLGNEPVRSQGHIHRVSVHSRQSPPELYEIWQGRAVIYMQETARDNPGRCFAVSAGPGETVLVPPGWAHCTISADREHPLTFGAWCDREYGFEYDEVRAHHGLAWYPVWEEDRLLWRKNPSYTGQELVEKMPEDYTLFGIAKNLPVYAQFERNPGSVQFVSHPALVREKWINYVP